MVKKTKMTKAGKRDPERNKKSTKAQRLAEREAKRAAKKGDGSFPDIMIATKEKDSVGKPYFLGHRDDMATIYEDGQTVAVYKLRRVSTISIKRKVVR